MRRDARPVGGAPLAHRNRVRAAARPPRKGSSPPSETLGAMNQTPPRAPAPRSISPPCAQRPRPARRAPRLPLMAVVKSDAYGHGLVPCARAARRPVRPGSAPPPPRRRWRCARPGSRGAMMCWLWTPGGPWREAIEADIDVAVSGLWALAEVRRAARAAGRTARIQLKADTGLGRNGCQPADWPELVAAAARRRGRGHRPGHRPLVALRLRRRARPPLHRRPAGRLPRDASRTPRRRACDPEVRHIANSPATLTLPESHFDLVRSGHRDVRHLARPELGTPAELGLRPVDDARRPPSRWSSRSRPGTASATATTTSPRRDHARPGPRSATRTASRATRPAGPGAGRRRAAHGRRAGRHGPVRGGPRRATARAGDEARHLRAGRPGRAHRRGLGARRQAPSPTRSSPVSEPGSPASM